MGRTRNPARDLPRSCTDCLAWGVMKQIRCRACRSFRDAYRDERECTGCGRTLRVKNGYCRLCWVQLSGGRAWEGTPPKTVAAMTAAGVRIPYHQLFFDKISPRAVTRPAVPHGPSAGKAPGRAWIQMDLLARPGSRRSPDLDPGPALAAALRIADGLAGSRGWSSEVRRRVRKGLRIALDGHQEGRPVEWSMALPRLRTAGQASPGNVAAVLRQAGMLHDDLPPVFDAWTDRKLGGVSAGIRRDTERWLRTLKDGGPRSAPRATATVYSHLGKALPALEQWSARYGHLREVTRRDIEDFLRPLHGSHRHNALVALRSLFAFCTADGTVFRNPTRGIKVGRRPSVAVLQPLCQDDIDDAAAAATTPAARLVIALAAVHAARSSVIRCLLLADADPASGRLLLNGLPRPADDLTARLLREWLEDRRARWPATANPYLLINAQTALGTTPVSRIWVNATLRGHAATIEALRVDRQLDEALASGADPLHLAATFGIDPGTAVRYASSARQLLQSVSERQDPGEFPANPRV